MYPFDWNAAISTLRETVPQTQFENWLMPVSLVRHTERSIVLGVPSRFHEEWVKANYARHIQQAIRKQCGTEIQLEFEIIAQANREASRAFPTVLPLLPPPPPSRPVLRVVDNAGSKAPPPRPESPNLPVFNHALIELPFNQMTLQLGGIFVRERHPLVNPLYVFAGVGMGKTHLLAHLGQCILAARPGTRVKYTNAESFTAEMVRSIKSDDALGFKRRYGEETDCLLFDDLQGIKGRIKTQETLLHIFNDIVNRGGRVAFASSVTPDRLEEFLEPLKSRLVAGVMGEIHPTSLEDRTQLLARMCEFHRISIEGPALRTLASQPHRDVRTLVGSLLRIHLQATIEKRTVDSEYVTGTRLQEPPKEAVTLEEIIALVEHNFGVSRTDMISKSRKGATTWARQVAMYLARHHTLLPLEEIGKTFGRDHATVIHAFQKVRETIETHPTRKYEVEFLKRKILAKAPRGQDVPTV